jgi:alpha-glucosidase
MLSFDFLNKGKKYNATIYEDDGKGSILKRSIQVDADTRFSINLKAASGSALIIEPSR